MTSNKLLSNLLTGTAIIASLGSSTYAGFKVFANNSSEVAVPEISTPAPSPSNSPVEEPVRTNNASSSISPVSPVEIVDEDPVDDDIVVPSVVPSPSPVSTDFPVASVDPGTKFGDDDGDENDELEHEEKKESEKHERANNEKVEDHEDE